MKISNNVFWLILEDNPLIHWHVTSNKTILSVSVSLLYTKIITMRRKVIGLWRILQNIYLTWPSQSALWGQFGVKPRSWWHEHNIIRTDFLKQHLLGKLGLNLHVINECRISNSMKISKILKILGFYQNVTVHHDSQPDECSIDFSTEFNWFFISAKYYSSMQKEMQNKNHSYMCHLKIF